MIHSSVSGHLGFQFSLLSIKLLCTSLYWHVFISLRLIPKGRTVESLVQHMFNFWEISNHFPFPLAMYEIFCFTSSLARSVVFLILAIHLCVNIFPRNSIFQFQHCHLEWKEKLCFYFLLIIIISHSLKTCFYLLKIHILAALKFLSVSWDIRFISGSDSTDFLFFWECIPFSEFFLCLLTLNYILGIININFWIMYSAIFL